MVWKKVRLVSISPSHSCDKSSRSPLGAISSDPLPANTRPAEPGLALSHLPGGAVSGYFINRGDSDREREIEQFQRVKKPGDMDGGGYAGPGLVLQLMKHEMHARRC